VSGQQEPGGLWWSHELIHPDGACERVADLGHVRGRLRVQLRQPIADHWRPYLVFRQDTIPGIPGDGWTFSLTPAEADMLAGVLRHAVAVMLDYHNPEGTTS